MPNTQNKPGLAQALRAKPKQPKSPFSAPGEMWQTIDQPGTSPAGPSSVPRFGDSPSANRGMPPQTTAPKSSGRTLPSFFSYSTSAEADDLIMQALENVSSPSSPPQGQSDDLTMQAPKLQKSTPAAVRYDKKAEEKAAVGGLQERLDADSRRRAARRSEQQRLNRFSG